MEPTFGTPEGTPDDGLRQRALERLERKQSFWKQVASYALVNGMLWVIWLISGFNGGNWFPWPIFPMLGWGIGLAFSARNIFMADGISEDKVQREMRRLQGE